MEKPNQYVDEDDSEDVVVDRLNKMVAKYKLHGKDDLDPADLPVNLQYAASHIKFHKVGYRPLALNAHSPMAPLCKMISDALIGKCPSSYASRSRFKTFWSCCAVKLDMCFLRPSRAWFPKSECN